MNDHPLYDYGLDNTKRQSFIGESISQVFTEIVAGVLEQIFMAHPHERNTVILIGTILMCAVGLRKEYEYFSTDKTASSLNDTTP